MTTVYPVYNKKDISDRPAKGSVVDPIDRDFKNVDVDRKLRFYGVATALRESRMPANQQIDSALAYVLTHSPVPTDQLSPDGQTLVQDTREILETLRAIVKEKNADELLQSFVWHTRAVDTDRAKKDPNEVLPVDQQKARDDARQATQHLRTLASLVLTNAEVRKLIEDFSVIGRDLLARGAVKVAEKTRPDEERLRRVDEPGPDSRFITAGGRQMGPDETPVPEARIPGTGYRVAQNPNQEIGQGTALKQPNGGIKSGDQAVDEAVSKKDELTEQAKPEAQWQREDVQDRVQEDTADDEPDVQTRTQRLQDKVAGVKGSLTGRVPQEHKDKANEHYNRVKNFLSEEYFPEERRDQLIFRLKKVIIECQTHEDYQGSIRWLLDYLEEYASHGRTLADHGKDSHQQLSSDPALQQAMSELRTLLERFANGMSLDVIGDAVRALYDDSQKDEDLRRWFQDVNNFVREALMQPGYVIDDGCNTCARDLREGGRRFYDEKYRGHFDNLSSSVTDWFSAWTNDPLNRRFGQDWARLTKDLLFDSEGSLKFKPELWMDIRRVILPSLMDHVGYIPIPRIEYTDDSLDLVLENLALTGRNLFPNLISMDAHNFIKFSPYNSIRDEQHHEFTLTFGQIQADMRDVVFWYHKKSGMPKMTDSGLADVLLGGAGMTVTAHIASAERDRSSVFKVRNVQVKVDTLKFAIRDSRHDTLYKTLLPLVSGLIKKQLQKVVGGAVQTALEYVDGQLVGVRDQMAEAKASEDRSRTQVLKEQLSRNSDKAQSKSDEKNSQFKVVARPEKEILPQAGHPAGWVNRTQERQEVATKGEEWRSDAFNIV
ncbi:hypothetical protein AcW1_003630 [Taiwanofungus camphoratus]|nr:hypothetical protein AcW1_003630 [Antrodia cinnamomea]